MSNVLTSKDKTRKNSNTTIIYVTVHELVIQVIGESYYVTLDIFPYPYSPVPIRGSSHVLHNIIILTPICHTEQLT